MKALTDEWQRWVQENYARGCDEASLVTRLIEAGFEPHTAGIAVLQAMAGIQTAPTPAVASAHGRVSTSPRIPQACSVIQTSDRLIRVSMRMLDPVVALFDNVMSPGECDQLIEMSHAKLQRSTIVDPQDGANRVIADRASSGTYFALNETAFITVLDRRIAELMHCPAENGEGLQILNYQVGGEYKPHFDYFPPEQSGSAVHLAKGGQRISTLIVYLNDVDAGGETIFPSLKLSFVPKRGSALYFEYCNTAGQVDPSTLHGGAPVQGGEKWIATKWMRQGKYS